MSTAFNKDNSILTEVHQYSLESLEADKFGPMLRIRNKKEYINDKCLIRLICLAFANAPNNIL